MIPSANPFTSATFPFHELNAISNAIEVMEHALPLLRAGKDRLSSHLDDLTTPTKAINRPELAYLSYDYRGTVRQCRSLIDVYLEVLRALWTDFPDRREQMAAAVARLGTRRTYVSKTRDGLFYVQSRSWAYKHSCRLVDDWFVDTNLSLERVAKVLPTAATAAGLTWGSDIRTRW